MGFPDHYVSRLAEVEAIADADAERHALNERVLNLMRE
jgi:hypothetical protein